MENTTAPLSALMLHQPSYSDSLSELVHSTECLSSKGYITTRLSDTDLEKKRRCVRCNILLAKEERRSRQRLLRQQDPAYAATQGLLPSNDPDNTGSLGMDQLQLEETPGPVLRCKFHDGRIFNKVKLLT
ncbi:hypothetical protein Forpi1262_v008410 [Fusarium oxysporum f. sp. raphani]|uniref:Uncharacterized protein n=1 Tax=Fusarium oxysporum f. sp. raphani TaxID=96318 RepID=A0A8J5Q1F4_FUSOX|nr:hypothetical protein Forpi1262_v008410 [Fusarium oxysporum f. sp. raphani]